MLCVVIEAKLGNVFELVPHGVIVTCCVGTSSSRLKLIWRWWCGDRFIFWRIILERLPSSLSDSSNHPQLIGFEWLTFSWLDLIVTLINSRSFRWPSCSTFYGKTLTHALIRHPTNLSTYVFSTDQPLVDCRLYGTDPHPTVWTAMKDPHHGHLPELFKYRQSKIWPYTY